MPDIDQQRDDLTINIHPQPRVIGRAYLDIVREKNWKRMAIAYDDSEVLIKYQEFLDNASDSWQVSFYQFESDSFRDIFWNMKLNQETNIIIDVHQKVLRQVMRSAQQVGFMTDKHSYIITSIDLICEDMDEFTYTGANITGFRLVKDENQVLVTLLNQWTDLNNRTGNRVSMVAPKFLTSSAALIFDATSLLVKALEALDGSQNVTLGPISCDAETSWPYGTSLVNYIRSISFDGITGLVSLDSFGYRSDIMLEILTIGRTGTRRIGNWHSTTGLNKTSNSTVEKPELAIHKQTWIVSTVLTAPFTMRRSSPRQLSGNSEFEGYVIDLIAELSRMIGFNYKIRLCKDEKHGSRQSNGSWDGMLGELIRNEADIAVTDLTITKAREQAVDFTYPFMSTGVSILFKKPEVGSSLFGFLSPFTTRAWLCILLAVVGISLIFFISGRVSPYEYKTNVDELKNDFSVITCFWFMAGSLLQNGSDLMPTAISTRIIASFWYFFALIMITSYTANLAAFLTIEELKYPFTSADELARMSIDKINYGCTESGSTRTTFRDSFHPSLKRLSVNMEQHSNWFVSSNKNGIERVLNGGFALFMEAAAIEYAVERNCDLIRIGGLLDSKSYGIATKKDSPIRQILSRGILKLQEQGQSIELICAHEF